MRVLHSPGIDERIKRTARELQLRLLAWHEIRLSSAARFLVKNLIPLVGLVVVYGPPKCGKTFWVFDLVMHIALGWEYRGRRTQQGTVVYCLFEGQVGFAARVEAFRQAYLSDCALDVPFYLMPVKLELVKDHQQLITAIRRQVGNVPPCAVIIDTLNRSFSGSESSDTDMTAYVRACDAIRENLDCVTIVVHHSGLEGGRARGHTALLGAADTQIGVKQDNRTNVIATVEYMKDGPAGEEIASSLKVVEVGIDDDGEPITSCIIQLAEAGHQTGERSTLTRNQITMLTILKAAGPIGLTVEEWNERAREAGLGTQRKADLYDVRTALQKYGFICKGVNGWFAKRA